MNILQKWWVDRKAVKETPALDLWEKRFETDWRGQRRDNPGTWVTADLWRAAMWERSALAYRAEGNVDRESYCMSRANEILAGVK